MTAKLLCQTDPKSGLMAQVDPVAVEGARDHGRDQLRSSPLSTTTLKYDPTAWDLLLDATAGGDQVYSPWALLYAADRYNGTTSNWFNDPEAAGASAAAALKVARLRPTSMRL